MPKKISKIDRFKSRVDNAPQPENPKPITVYLYKGSPLGATNIPPGHIIELRDYYPVEPDQRQIHNTEHEDIPYHKWVYT